MWCWKIFLTKWMHFHVKIFHQKHFCLLSGVSLQQDRTTDIIPTQGKNLNFEFDLPQVFAREHAFCQVSWKMESGGWTCGYIQRPQGFRPPRRRAGSQQMWITSNGQALCWKIGVTILISRVRKFCLWEVKLLAHRPKAVNGAGIQIESSIFLCRFSYISPTPAGTSEFRLSSARENASWPQRKPLLLSLEDFLHLSPTMIGWANRPN